ncbi:MAG: NTPase, partial [Thermoproteota archaeon]
FITGKPGTGKTTILTKIIKTLRDRGYQIGGMVSREAREGGRRVGFKVRDLTRGREGWLAHVKYDQGPRVGKYRVNLKDLEEVGVEAIGDAVEQKKVIAIDEIGPMELYSNRFKEEVRRAMNSGKPLIGTIHWRARDELIEEIKVRKDSEITEVTYENRDKLSGVLVDRVVKFLERQT